VLKHPWCEQGADAAPAKKRAPSKGDGGRKPAAGPAERKRCEKLLKVVIGKEEAGPFRQPVDPDAYPQYYETIEVRACPPDTPGFALHGNAVEPILRGARQVPMDLTTIKTKLSGAMYGSVELFIKDLRLVFDNCRLFNALDSDICEVAARLTALSERLIAGWLTATELPALADLDDDRCQVRHCCRGRGSHRRGGPLTHGLWRLRRRARQVCATNYEAGNDCMLLCDGCDAVRQLSCHSPRCASGSRYWD
jgi:hypothetical protein